MNAGSGAYSCIRGFRYLVATNARMSTATGIHRLSFIAYRLSFIAYRSSFIAYR